MEPPTATPEALHAAHGRARPLSAALRLLLPLAAVLALATALVGGTWLSGRWLLTSEPGALWLLSHLPGVQVDGLRGAVLGERWQAERIVIRWDSGRKSLTLEGLVAEGLRWQWRPPATARSTWVALEVDSLTVRRAQLITGPPSGQPLTLPSSLAIPLQLQLARARIERLEIDALAPVTGLQLQGLALDSRTGAAHAVQQLDALWQGYAVQGSGRIGHAAPLPLQLQASVRPALDGDTPRWAAVLQASGPAERLAITGKLRGVPRGTRPAPVVDLSAELRPLRAWPIERLDLRTRELDLAALSGSAPETRLSGEAQISARAANAPIAATLQLANALPGRWNEGRLPLARIEAELQGRLDQPDRLELTRFAVQLADAAGRSAVGAGRWSGRALWQDHRLTLDSRVDELRPQQLDSRAAAMRLTGPLSLTLDGLPSPDAAAAAPRPAWQAAARLDLEGQLDATAQPVKLLLDAQADADHVELRQLRAQAGNAVAELAGNLRRGARGSWTLATQGTVSDFDPLPWFPGEIGSAWRQGRHRLSASWQFDLRLPAEVRQLAARSWLALAPRVAGNGSLKLRDSQLAGVPLQGELTLAYAPGAPGTRAPAAPASGTMKAEFRVGGNVLRLEGRGDPAGDGHDDRLSIELQAEQLATLAPLASLHPDLADWLPRQGSARVDATLSGRWPALHTEGRVRLQELQAGRLAVARGNVDWTLDSGANEPLSLVLDLAGVRLGAQRASLLRGTLAGTLAAHRIDLDGALPLAPPAAAGAWLGLQGGGGGTRALLRAQGRWQPAAAGGGRWSAQVERLTVAGWDGTPLPASPAALAPAVATPLAPATAPGSAPANASGSALWADARDLRAELSFDAEGALAGLQAAAGRVRLADAATLRWDEVRVNLQGERAQVELRAEVEPFAVAPLLARLQPSVGWAGDLRVTARMQVKAGERFDADVSIERHDGDLHLVSTDGVQLMGLSELRLGLAAHDGLWTLRQDLAGRTLGELRSTVRVRSAASARWPSPDDPLDGKLQLRVADVGIWGGWVPVGWRLVGELAGEATLGGRFADPQFIGQVSGSRLGVRNLLQGVNVADGQLLLRLDGSTAQVERFTLRGGDGLITVTGGATLGRAPTAQLQFKAERFRAIGRVDRQLIVSGNGVLALDAQSLKLDARLAVDEGLYDASREDAPSLDDDVSIRRAGAAAPAAEPAAPPAPRRNVAVTIDLDLGQKLRIRGRGLDAALTGQLRLTTPGGRPWLVGSVSAERGTYAAYGQKLEIERGTVAFSGPWDNARLDVLALRPNIDQRVGVSITGSTQMPRVRLYSEPDLSDNEKLSWLVLGRAPDGLGRTDTALLQRAAVALLAGEGEAPTDALMRSLGIDDLSLRQSEGDVRETVIGLGKQLSRRWYLGYERGVNATTGTWQLVYRIAQHFTLRAQSGLDNALDVIWTWRVGETPVPPEGAVRKSVVVPP